MSFFGRAPRQEGAPARSNKVMHGLKVTMSPATSKREITESDDSHKVTQQTLASWKAALRALHDALATNEAAWKNLFASFTTFSTAAAAVYSATDVESRAVVKALESARTAVETPPTTDPGYTPMQMVEFARQELAAMLSRIQNSEALHAKRLETTRQYKYYDRKTKQMLENEAKPGKTVSPREVERRTRNQKNVMDLAIQLNSITTQLYTELEYIDMERLAVTDRSVAAMLMLQKYYFDFQPVKDAYAQGDKIRLGRRVIPRDEVRQWMPNTLQPAAVTPQISNSPMMQQGVPAIAAPVPPASTMPPGAMQQQPYPQHQLSNGGPAAYSQGQMLAPQPVMQHQASAPPVQPPVYSQPMQPQPLLPPINVQHAQPMPEQAAGFPSQPQQQYSAQQFAPPQPVPPQPASPQPAPPQTVPTQVTLPAAVGQ